MTDSDLGIDVEKVKEKSQESHNWRNPVWRNEDGTIAEW